MFKRPFRMPCSGGCGKQILVRPPGHMYIYKRGYCRDCGRRVDRANTKTKRKLSRQKHRS